MGIFDVFLIRQKIYRGEFHARCEFQTADGDWHPVSEHPAFAEVLWLVGADKKKKGGVRRRAIGAGWKIQGEETVRKRGAAVRIDKKAPSAASSRANSDKKAGLLGRFFGGKK